MIERKSLDKAKEDLIEASYYWEMFHSEVCWKGNPSIVSKMLRRLKSESAKLEALKENLCELMIRAMSLKKIIP